jgi:Protein of unknown function (DUF3237)
VAGRWSPRSSSVPNRRHVRISSGRNNDVFRGVLHAVDRDRPGAGEPPGAAQEVDAPARQPALLAGVGVARDQEVAPRQRRLHVHIGSCRRLARAFHRLPRIDGALLYVRSHGVRDGSADVLARLARGDDVEPSEYIFRTLTRIETAAPELDWMNRGVFISVGGRQPGAVIYETYLVA